MGVHVGDVMVRAGDLFGDGVNIAARLQTLARAGGVPDVAGEIAARLAAAYGVDDNEDELTTLSNAALDLIHDGKLDEAVFHKLVDQLDPSTPPDRRAPALTLSEGAAPASIIYRAQNDRSLPSDYVRGVISRHYDTALPGLRARPKLLGS